MRLLPRTNTWHTRVLKFADLERFFCCTSCKGGYTEKYKGRIDSIKRKYEGKSEI